MGMLIGHSRPVVSSWSLHWTSTSAASFVTSATALTDDSVSSATRITWANNQAGTGFNLDIRAIIATSDIRICGLMGLTLPVGTRIDITAFDFDFTPYTASQRVMLLPDNSRAAWFVFPADVIGCGRIDIIIYNDVLGSGLTSPITFDIGEAWFSPAFEVAIKPSVVLKSMNTATVRRSTNGQPFPLLRRSYRTLSVDTIPVTYASAYSDPNSLAMIRGTVDYAATCVCIPTYIDQTTRLLSNAVATEQALFGWCSNLGQITRMPDGHYYTLSLGFDEYPPSTI